MLLILDQDFPKRVAGALSGHSFRTAYGMGWATLTNGDLLSAAESAGFHVILTADRRIRYQQNLKDRQIALALQLRCLMFSESMGVSHQFGDGVDVRSLDGDDVGTLGVGVARGQGADAAVVPAGADGARGNLLTSAV